MDGYDSSQSIPLMTTTKIISILQKWALLSMLLLLVPEAALRMPLLAHT